MRSRILILMGTVFMLVILFWGTGGADEYYVSDAAGINSAMNSAENTVGMGDTINIAAGFYSITSTLYINDTSESSLALIGQGPGVTILDGNGTTQILRIDTSGGAGPTSLIHIKDMTFQNGNAAAGSGGGAYVKTNGAALLVDNVEFLSNESAMSGGGLFYETQTGSSTVKNSLFDSNTVTGGAGSAGGGLYEYSIVNAQPFKLEDNTFVDNLASADGGGAHINVQGIEIRRNIVRSNSTTSGTRGGYWISSKGNSVQIVNNLFDRNSAGGLAVSQFSGQGEIHVTNNSFYGNSSTGAGAGLDLDTGVDLTETWITNNVFYGNVSSGVATDLWVLNDSDFNNTGSPVSILYNNFSAAAVFDTDDGNVTIANNLNTDPLFVDAPNSDFQLSSASPCIDAGDTTVMSETVDLAGNPRFVDDPLTADTGNSPGATAAVDMGALEFQADTSSGGGGGGGGGGCSTAGPVSGIPLLADLFWITMLVGMFILMRRKVKG